MPWNGAELKRLKDACLLLQSFSRTAAAYAAQMPAQAAHNLKIASDKSAQIADEWLSGAEVQAAGDDTVSLADSDAAVEGAIESILLSFQNLNKVDFGAGSGVTERMSRLGEVIGFLFFCFVFFFGPSSSIQTATTFGPVYCA